RKTAILNASKIRQIGALGSCVHFKITFCGNSRQLLYHYYLFIVQPCAGLNEKVYCKLACMSTF
ncbi:MAG: hypothetical protein KH611_14945, partial [Clostridium sp.]|nr:hypothetical protein [Clostridium sp.]